MHKITKLLQWSAFAAVLVCTQATAATCYRDNDCGDGNFCNGIERCMPGVAGTDARGCKVATQPACTASQECVESERRCVIAGCGPSSSTRDSDGDGVNGIHCGGADCEDTNPNRYPGNREVCGDNPAQDEDCDLNSWGQKSGTANDRDFIDCQPGRGAQQDAGSWGATGTPTAPAKKRLMLEDDRKKVLKPQITPDRKYKQ